jgi:hypothetical protein
VPPPPTLRLASEMGLNTCDCTCGADKSLPLSTNGEFSRPASCSETEREDEVEEEEDEVGRIQVADPVLGEVKYFLGG